ncbi:MAG: DEAD/DEAH box helicase family protein [Phycisphaerae bacterium]|nr:DEAD/DEAH box helicase family protein [Phycisphaerae bacterium]
MEPPDEPTTRKRRIDPKLQAAGWNVVPFDSTRPLSAYDRCAIEEYPTANGPADYALCLDARIVAIIEAKRPGADPQEVLPQTERYARGLTDMPIEFGGYHAPFLYATNGDVIWHRDARHPMNASRKIAAFHTPQALIERLADTFDLACAGLMDTTNDHPRLRPYQREANAAVEQAITQRKRRMLVAMATGTGKTFTTVNQVYRLMKSGVAKRILFLVDRRALAAQAVRAFASFELLPGLKFDRIYEVYSQRFKREDLETDEKWDPKVLPPGYLRDPRPGHAFVYVCTIQRLAVNVLGRNAIFGLGDEDLDPDAEQEPIPIHAFDVIIADECHRGYTSAELSVWRNTLDHFDAVKIGLTATPASHTTAYFTDVVYRYEYERAVHEGYLVDYDVVTIKSDVRMKGLFLNEGEEVEQVDPKTGARRRDLLEDEREFESTEIERSATSPDSNRKILAEIKKYADEHEARYHRFPKTLIFAVSDVPHVSHADSLTRIARDVFARGDQFVRKITGKVDRPLQEIRNFRNRRVTDVVVTVDMLSTGVDIPDLEFIVFLRPVKSRILFEQMLGRGTRRGENCPNKSHFTVFDCFDGTLIEYFRQATDITAEPPQREARTIPEIIDAIWNNRDRDYNVRCLVKRLHRIDKEMSADARELFSAFIDDGDLAHYANRLPRRLHEDFTHTMSLLRDPSFQDLLLNYPRAPKTFTVAPEAQDTVTSAWLVRGTDGKEYRPDDYLAAFARFVRENPDHVEAIRILLDRPQAWSTQALTELRAKLAAAPQRFRVDDLERAHRLHYHKALVDLISMVKHAADETQPLYTAAERVEAAFARITAGHTFTNEQQKWFDRIKEHLVENLTIDHEDFDDLPVFARAGGWGRANRVFEGQLPGLIRLINEAVAA